MGGLAVVLLAADLLVRGATDLAASLKVPTPIISLTIVSFGASSPEMAVAFRSALNGSGEIGLGVVIGSSVANTLIVLGLPALLFPISAQTPGLKPHAAALVAAALAFCGVGYGVGAVGSAAGAALLSAVFAYIGLMAIQLRKNGDDPALRDQDYFRDRKAGLRSVLYLAAALVGLPVGAGLVAAHATTLADLAGVRREVVATSIVASAAALPELATVAGAALRRKSDVALGAAIGSNVFNLLAAGGLVGLGGGGRFTPAMRTLDMPVLLAATATVAAFVFLRRDIGRLAGAAMAAAYIVFVVSLWTLGDRL